MTENVLYYGDNLDIMRRYLADGSVDLEYLDPPFNSNATYNVLFAERNGAKAAAQIKAFEDTWTWDETAAKLYQETVERGGQVSRALQAFRGLLGDSNMMAYLTNMAPRLVELHRILKPTGSIYLHCDPTASHYLKVLMDAVFGAQNFRSQIVWRRKGGSALKGMRTFSTATDLLLFYSRGEQYTFDTVYMPLDEDYIKSNFTRVDEHGRRFQATVMRSPNPRPNLMYDYKGYKTPPNGWAVSREKMEQLDKEGRLYFPEDHSKQIYKKIFLDEYPGQPANNLWTDIPTLKGQSPELLGYPTQKPEALLARIIAASCPEGGTVLDPFAGCGTSVVAAQRAGHPWIGIDITHLAINLVKLRLRDIFGDSVQYKVIGEPTTVADAQDLADQDPYQFQWWALGLVGARPTEQKKGSDKGIDGRLYFHDEPGGKTKQIIFSVKAGHNLGVAYVHELRGVIEREGAQIGVLITMYDPTKPMRTDVASAGFYISPWGKHPRLQILTVGELLAGKKIDMPPAQGVNVTFEKAPKAKKQAGKQQEMGL